MKSRFNSSVFTLLCMAILGVFVLLSACNSRTEQEVKEDTQVENMVEKDQQKADSMKRALGIE